MFGGNIIYNTTAGSKIFILPNYKNISFVTIQLKNRDTVK